MRGKHQELPQQDVRLAQHLHFAHYGPERSHVRSVSVQGEFPDFTGRIAAVDHRGSPRVCCE